MTSYLTDPHRPSMVLNYADKPILSTPVWFPMRYGEYTFFHGTRIRIDCAWKTLSSSLKFSQDWVCVLIVTNAAIIFRRSSSYQSDHSKSKLLRQLIYPWFVNFQSMVDQNHIVNVFNYFKYTNFNNVSRTLCISRTYANTMKLRTPY